MSAFTSVVKWICISSFTGNMFKNTKCLFSTYKSYCLITINRIFCHLYGHKWRNNETEHFKWNVSVDMLRANHFSQLSQGIVCLFICMHSPAKSFWWSSWIFRVREWEWISFKSKRQYVWSNIQPLLRTIVDITILCVNSSSSVLLGSPQSGRPDVLRLLCGLRSPCQPQCCHGSHGE